MIVAMDKFFCFAGEIVSVKHIESGESPNKKFSVLWTHEKGTAFLDDKWQWTFDLTPPTKSSQ